MSYSDYAQHIEEQSTSIQVEDAFYMAPTEQWELADFEDILESV